MIFSNNRTGGLLFCLAAYLTAILLCYLFVSALPYERFILNAFILDLLATFTIFLFSIISNNSSIYDPYWSIAPPVIFLYWIFSGETHSGNPYRQVLIMLLVLFWSVRLTWNWIRRWQGLFHEDWRYVRFRNQYTKYYWSVSLLGIHLFPTLIVFIACVSVYPALVLTTRSPGIVDLASGLVTITAIIIEALSDQQLRIFLLNRGQESFLSKGLWRYSRHPNYFGEILFWAGLFLFSLGSDLRTWWIYPGPVCMVLLFFFISVPMIDKRMLMKRKGYRDYYHRTSGLILWFPKKDIKE